MPRALCAAIFLSVVAALGDGSPAYMVWAADAAGVPAPDFERLVAPLLAHRCAGCHAGEEAQGQLNLMEHEATLRGGESGPAVVPGDLEASWLWQRVASDEMPPKHPLPAAEKELLRAWILAGAPWQGGRIDPLKFTTDARGGYDWWSLQPLQPVTIPATGSEWSRNPIDRFIAKQHADAGLQASQAAERRVLIRRLTFDLLGLPPTPEDVTAFVADTRPDAYEQLVERLLASPHYGERWARHWLDVVRFGESNGFERDLPRENAWRYRDWVVDAFNRNLPYNEFVRWQLAGDSLAPEDPQAQHALGFLVAGPHDTVIPVSVNMRQTMRQDEMEDLIGVVTQTFLGLTANCARCHDHKFDPITAKEYYQLAAVFAGVDHTERTITPPAAQQQLAEWQQQITQVETALREQTASVLPEILRQRSSAANLPAVVLPAPLAMWDFTTDLRDRIGQLHGTWQGPARATPQGLEFDGQQFVSTPPLPADLTEKTLEVRVKLTDLDQRGGGVMSVQSLDGSLFDAIVFGEQQPQRWMSGSNFFQRTASFDGSSEDLAASEFITMTLVYGADGSIAAYRNGKPYGRTYSSTGPVTFAAGQSQILFGLRHSPAGGNRQLRGIVSAAKLYRKALTAAEVEASVKSQGGLLTESDVLAALTPGERQQRQSQTQQLAELRQKQAELAKSAPYAIYTASLNQPTATHVLRRGSVTTPGEVVAPAALSALVGLEGNLQLKPDAIESTRREQLARWLTDDRNALFARVMANRLWHYHFGQGLVATPNDLGFNGGRPSHPELLDWLAGEFIANGYSIKHMHRLLVTSATYRQASTYRADAAAHDADNRWLWRMPPRRLDAESLRDAMLVAAGELNTELGGKGYTDFNSYFFKGTQFYDPVETTSYTQQRRTIYRMWARGGRNPFLDTFDCPDPSTTSPKRSATTTPLQALSLLNNAFSRKMADRLAQRLQPEGEPVTDRTVDRAYELLFAREPDREERGLVREFATTHGLPAACLGLLNSSEFLYVD